MNLNFKEFGFGFPVIILHGLLGSLDNWQTIARKISELPSAPFKTYIIDQRNHGKSPHSDDFNYELLSADIAEFYKQQNITKAHIIGHSMGGKAAMKFTLENQDLVEKLIVVDIAPSEAEDNHTNIFEALVAANVTEANSREEVEKVLRDRIGDDNTTIQFLMKGLQRDVSEKHFAWKFNLAALWNHYEDIMDGITGAQPFMGPTLFVKGGKSDYINADNYPDIIELFPNNQLAEIPGAGHWVQAEKPVEFIEVTEKFLIGT
jgi:pimeloyl-ACP methyl ester carboxylesterase